MKGVSGGVWEREKERGRWETKCLLYELINQAHEGGCYLHTN